MFTSTHNSMAQLPSDWPNCSNNLAVLECHQPHYKLNCHTESAAHELVVCAATHSSACSTYLLENTPPNNLEPIRPFADYPFCYLAHDHASINIHYLACDVSCCWVEGQEAHQASNLLRLAIPA
eukprot:GHRR01023387.1.p1 GENE.GHRR01023387.1~~GHRR01023387.1.p1  ORF type:complete len:124 (-),score=15.79 GHRR01023387.1:731-1102(-)